MTPYELAYHYAMQTNRCIFLTGKAGTGKTTFLRKLKGDCPKQLCVVAPTGVAAINAEGVTIHSFFQLPPQLFQPTDEARRFLFQEMQLREQKRRVLKNLELLVIDEVSMVRADLMDTMDAVLRHFKHRPTLPFGGVQVLFIGDLYQLSPVARQDEWQVMRTWYDGPYFFQARVFREMTPVYIELDKVYRQTNQHFVQLLNQVRENKLNAEGLAQLNSRFKSLDTHALLTEQSILLTTHNRKADMVNEREMDALSAHAYTFDAIVDGTFPESIYPMDTHLILKEGARVMFIKNDSNSEKAYYNGKLGTVSELSQDHIVVTCDDKQVITCHQEIWENVRYSSKENSDLIQSEVIGSFTHYPLRLAWAVTIHKAQGLTFEQVIIDAEEAFAAGQVYVALSRCRCLEGITLTSKIPERALANAVDVILFTERQPAIHTVEEQLTTSEVTYLSQLLCGCYDFRELIDRFYHLRSLSLTLSSLQGHPTEWLIQLTGGLNGLQVIGERFQRQIQALLLNPSTDAQAAFNYLQERIKAAADYFAPKLETLVHQIEECPIRSNDKDDAKNFQPLLEELYDDLSRRIWIIRHGQDCLSVSGYFAARRSFRGHPLDIAIYTLAKKKRSTSSKPTRTSKASRGKTPTPRKLVTNQKIAAAAFQTLMAFMEHRTIALTAADRGIDATTIATHLQVFVQQGVLSKKDFTDSDWKKMNL